MREDDQAPGVVGPVRAALDHVLVVGVDRGLAERGDSLSSPAPGQTWSPCANAKRRTKSLTSWLQRIVVMPRAVAM